ncbi:Aste57867_4290 [Aphanomyces stellatus]|uniref:Aste57867_4290 protein n=1 Tax=Aphanomyces stellatus TaxID=120398 RepID=A0A485KBH9_9STRA|nr:hypothetical protein As57867_004279 [Aphanomyces stellatus]VFT81405.1 Aste57867_4290 [Aphanomyces stellatus]
MRRGVCAFITLAVTSLAESSVNPTLPVGLPNPVLDLSGVIFRSKRDTFRVQVALSDGNNLPMRIWLESMTSYAQWTSVVTDFQKHASPDANYILPSRGLIAGLLQALSAVNTGEDHAELDLVDGKTNHLRMLLGLKLFSSLHAEYEFELQHLPISKIDIVEAKLRYLENTLPVAIEQVEAKLRIAQSAMARKPSIYVSFSTTRDQADVLDISWDKQHASNPDYVDLSPDKSVIIFKKPGIYQVHAICTVSNGNAKKLCLQIDGLTELCTGFTEFHYSPIIAALTSNLIVTKENTQGHVSCMERVPNSAWQFLSRRMSANVTIALLHALQ